MRRRTAAAAFALVLPAAFGAAAPAAQAQNTLRYAFQGELKVLDEYSLNETFSMGVLGNVYEGLVKRDGDLNIVPGLATSWRMVDPLTWRFELRQGVRFQDGHPFTADDVLFSADRVRSEGSDLATRIPADAVFTKIDDHTVEVKLTTPNPILIGEWDTWGIMDKEWTEANDAVAVTSAADTAVNYAALHANGTGPFKVVSHQPGVRTVLEANPDWWGWADRRFNIDRVEFTPIASDATRVAALLSGEMDLVDPVPLQDFARVEANPATEVVSEPELRTVFLGFDQTRDALVGSDVTDRNPFKDVRVRRAFLLAIDEEAIAARIMRGRATPSALMIAPSLFGRGGEFVRPKADPAAAKALLAEAGYPNGFSLTMDCPNDRYVNDGEICQAVAAMLARVGVRVNLAAVPKSQFFAKVLAPGGYDTSFYLLGWTPAGLDAYNVLYNLLACRQEGGGHEAAGAFNLGGYCNPELDRLTAQIVAETDLARRDELIAQAFRIATDDVATIPLHQQSLAWGKARAVEITPRADNIVMFDSVRK
jgi:peptide/nickel transport system substrate-binding protein